MKIIVTAAAGAPVKLSPTITNTYPRDWIGDVSDAVGKDLVAKKLATKVEAAPIPVLTPAQTKVLGAAADDIIATATKKAEAARVSPVIPAKTDAK